MCNNNIIGVGYKKTTIAEFLDKNKDLLKNIKIEDLYEYMVKLSSAKINQQKVKIGIYTSSYTARLIKRNTYNINLVLISIILNFNLTKNNWKAILEETSNIPCDIKVNKMFNKEIYFAVCSFLPTNIREDIMSQIGLLLNYYYLVKK